MIKLKIKARDVNVAVSKLNKNANLAVSKIDSIMDHRVKEAAQDAISNLDAQYGDLKASIGSEKISVLKYKLKAEKDYAAYVEFGTGKWAAAYVNSIEPEWKQLASKFKINGLGTMPEKPYLYPAVQKMWKNMLEEIKKATNARYK